MHAPPPGSAGFLTRHHTAALSVVAALTGLATAVATALAWFQSIVWIDVAALALGAVLAGLVALWQTRHGALAALVALTPLPGLIWAAPLSAGAHFAMTAPLGYGFGFAVATLYAQLGLDRALRAGRREPPWLAAAAILTVASVLAVIWFPLNDAALQALADSCGAALSVLLLLPLALVSLSFDEAYIAGANRARERRICVYERFGGAVVPRWALSYTGIALIFVALAWFDTDGSLVFSWWRCGVSAIVVCATLGVIAGGWREGVSLSVVLALVCLMAQWWCSYAPRLEQGAIDVFAITIFAGLLAMVAARQITRWRHNGDLSANRRALETVSPAMFAVLGAVVALMPSLRLAGAAIVMLSLVFAGCCGALLYPIVLTALETLIPRRRSVDEVFARPRA